MSPLTYSTQAPVAISASVGEVALTPLADGSTGDVTCGMNSNCSLSLDSKTLMVTLTAPPVETAIGSTTGLQYPVTVISSSGITDAGGNPWDLNNSTDRVIGPLGQ